MRESVYTYILSVATSKNPSVVNTIKEIIINPPWCCKIIKC